MKTTTNLNEAIILNAYNIGNKRFATIPVSELRIDTAYQRTLRKKALRMAAAWDYEKCDALTVSYRDDVFYIIDGQHRYEAAKRNNVYFLPCQIYTGLTQHQEAEKFVESNTNVSLLSPYDTYRANILIGDRIDTAVKDCCDSFGVKIAEDKGKREPTVLGSLAVARNIVKIHGNDCLEWIFSVLKAAGWYDRPNGFNSTIVSALKNIYKNYPGKRETVGKRCVEILSLFDYRTFCADAVNLYPRKANSAAVHSRLVDLIEGKSELPEKNISKNA